MSKVRQNYHEECEASINKQINMELYASYVYMSMVSQSFCIHCRTRVDNHEFSFTVVGIIGKKAWS